MNPRCTIILPVHNGMPYLVESIESLLGQTTSEILIYVLDDGSSDGTADYLKSLTDRRLRIFQLNKVGLVPALNYGMERVETEYMARMDADDIAEPWRIEKQIAFLDAHPDHVLIGGRIRYISADGKKMTWTVNVPVDNDSIIAGMRSRSSVIFHPTILCRADIMKKIGGYDAETFPAEDYDLYFRMSQSGKLANLPDVVLKHRVTSGSIISKQFAASLHQYQLLAEKYTQKRPGVIEKAYDHCDMLSAVVYRNGLDSFLNGNRFVGYLQFILSGLLNPFRAVRFIGRRIK